MPSQKTGLPLADEELFERRNYDRNLARMLPWLYVLTLLVVVLWLIFHQSWDSSQRHGVSPCFDITLTCFTLVVADCLYDVGKLNKKFSHLWSLVQLLFMAFIQNRQNSRISFQKKRSDQVLQFLFGKRFHTFNLEIYYAIYQYYMTVYFCFKTGLIDGK